MGSKLIVRAAVCGRHFDDDCTGCASAKDWANSEMDELRDRIATLEAELEKLRPQVKVADDQWDAKCDELAAMKARGDRLAGFARHEGLCGLIGFYGECTCGLAQALTELRDQ